MLVSITDLVVAPFLASRRTRNRVPPVDLARLALLYVTEVSNGNRSPARWLAERYPETSEKTWMNHFSRLRSLDMLTAPPRRGRVGGELGTVAHDLLLGPQLPSDLWEEYLDEREPVGRTPREEASRAAVMPKPVPTQRKHYRSGVIDKAALRHEGFLPPRADRRTAVQVEADWEAENPDAGWETFEDWFGRMSRADV